MSGTEQLGNEDMKHSEETVADMDPRCIPCDERVGYVDDETKVQCLECGELFGRISPQHLWYKHRMSIREYLEKHTNALLAAPALKEAYGSGLRGLTYEEKFGKERADQIKAAKAEATRQLHQDPDWKEARDMELRSVLSREDKRKAKSDYVRIMRSQMAPEWKKNHLFVLDQSGGVCEVCGCSDEDLFIHHKDCRYWVNDVENLQAVCRRCHGVLHNEMKRVTGRRTLVTRIEQSCYEFLAALSRELHIDMSADDYKDTPARMARMYYELFGSNIDFDKRVDEILSRTFPSKYDGMVISDGIRVYSMCKHHFLPAIMDVVIGYIPSKDVLGLSKLARIAELFAAHPLVQEDYTNDLADKIMEVLTPAGVGVYVKGVHYCQTMRGAKQRNAVMTTTCLRGCFKDDTRTRAEFLAEVHNKIGMRI